MFFPYEVLQITMANFYYQPTTFTNYASILKLKYFLRCRNNNKNPYLDMKY